MKQKSRRYIIDYSAWSITRIAQGLAYPVYAENWDGVYNVFMEDYNDATL